jgi:hypothetical protein
MGTSKETYVTHGATEAEGRAKQREQARHTCSSCSSKKGSGI